MLVPAERFELPAGTPPVPLEVHEFVLNGKCMPYYKTSSIVLLEYQRAGKTDYAHKLEATGTRTTC